jgi:allantoinase
MDVLISGATVVAETGIERGDLLVRDGIIVAIGAAAADAGVARLDAAGCTVLPAMIDSHVHFNAPGRSYLEGWRSGSAALAAGGAALAVDMPINSDPPTLTAAAFAAKAAEAAAESSVDFAIWGGLTPTNLDRLDELAAAGVVGFKAFMSNPGTDDFTAADDLTLYDGMRQAARLGLPVAVHAENDVLTAGIAARLRAAGRTGVADFLASRPLLAELEAIQRVIVLAEATGCRVHIVHVSSGRGAALVAAAQARGVAVTCETCPHYLVFTADDITEIGPLLKCQPPLRDAATQAELWQALERGDILTIGSDHAPGTAESKQRDDWFAVWAGIAGAQSSWPQLIEHAYHRRGISLPTLGRLLSSNVADLLALPRKGRIAVGYDADLAIVALDADATLQPADLLDRQRANPYVGRPTRGRVLQTLRRGVTIARDGRALGGAGGQLMRPVQR